MLISQGELAEILSVSLVTVNRWENDKFDPTIKIKRELQALFKENNIKTEGGREMITGDLRSKIDNIWETFWTGGLANPLSVIEQVTYLLFIKLLDDNQIKKERNAQVLGVEPKNLLFKSGNYIDEKENNI